MSEPKKVTKAVIAAAGFGTRFLPQTKAMPKEMIPLIDKPIIQYVVEELVSSGIKDIIIIESSNKRAIEDHFDLPNEDLLNNLRGGGEKKAHYINEMHEISNLANFIYVRQKGPYGNATPIMCAAHLIGDEPFIYTYADDFFVATPRRTEQLIDTYNKFGGSVFACRAVEDDADYNRYGIVGGESIDPATIKMDKIVEKPGKLHAPSNMASVNGYLFVPEFLQYIEKAAKNFQNDGEFMLQPIMQQMIADGYDVYAKEIENGRYYDTGDKLEYIKTVIDFAISHTEIGDDVKKYIRKLNLQD